MVRCFASAIALALALAACGGSVGGGGGAADAPIRVGECTLSSQCPTGNWCNPGSALCEPRGTIDEFERDVYPVLRDQGASSGCHVPGVKDSKDPNGQAEIAVFSGGPNVAFASLTAEGTN